MLLALDLNRQPLLPTDPSKAITWGNAPQEQTLTQVSQGLFRLKNGKFESQTVLSEWPSCCAIAVQAASLHTAFHAVPVVKQDADSHY